MASYLIKVTFDDAKVRFSVTICFMKNFFFIKNKVFASIILYKERNFQ